MNRHRTQIYRKFAAVQVEHHIVNDYRVPVPDTDTQEQYDTDTIQLQDLTYLPRAGIKGKNIESDFANSLDIKIPAVNMATLIDPSTILIRLSAAEILLQEINHETREEQDIASILSALNRRPVATGLYGLPRQHSHHVFKISGNRCEKLFNRLCAFNFDREIFHEMSVAQTRMAHISVIIVRKDNGAVPAYLLFVDSSMAEYFWDCMNEEVKVVNEQN